MIKVMLVDDDVPMLKYLKQLIPWSEKQMNICAATYSSVQARGLFQECSPDLVIIDIGLPQINGLDLATEFKKARPDVRIIFLTCHEDFYYAKRAVQIEADDYLIKDELTDELLNKSLEKSIRLMNQYKESLENISYRDVMKKNKEILIPSLLEKVLSGIDPSLYLSDAETLGFQWNQPEYLIAEAVVNYTSLLSSYTMKDLLLIHYAVCNIALELCQDAEGFAILFDKQHRVIIVYNYKKNMAINHIQRMNEFLENVYAQVKQYLKVLISFYCYDAPCQLPEFRAHLERLQHKKDHFFYTPEQIIYISNQKSINSGWSIPSTEGLDDSFSLWMNEVEKEDASRLKDEIHKWGQRLLNKPIEPEYLRMTWVQKLPSFSFLYRKEELLGVLTFLIRNTYKFDQMITILQSKLIEALHADDLEHLSLTETKPRLQEIEQYIYKNMSASITSVDIANYLHLNPSYFSRYFKQLSGETVTDFVHRYKMKTAMKLLSIQHESIESTALQLGYSDRSYFSKVFKKYCGQSPGAFVSKIN